MVTIVRDVDADQPGCFDHVGAFRHGDLLAVDIDGDEVGFGRSDHCKRSQERAVRNQEFQSPAYMRRGADSPLRAEVAAGRNHRNPDRERESGNSGILRGSLVRY